jgi:carbonic anhydrase
MTRMTPLLERNQQFAATYTPAPLAEHAAQMVILTCLDHRVDRWPGRRTTGTH